ncbi:MAG: fluoride efflux transporter CrcB [Bacteroidota bacterium]|nr:fluoride efflux transporter CrcB [Bacteroidota bacterium]
MEKFLFIGLGGFLGSIARYWLATAVYKSLGESFPYGTLSVNIIGCFMIGFLMTVFEERFLALPELRLFLVVGILGGFTTFSSFSYETIALLRAGNFLYGSLNVLLSVVVCLVFTWIGIIVGKIM